MACRFVTFESEEAVAKVFEAGQMHRVGGKQVEVKSATPKGSGPQAGGRGMPYNYSMGMGMGGPMGMGMGMGGAVGALGGRGEYMQQGRGYQQQYGHQQQQQQQAYPPGGGGMMGYGYSQGVIEGVVQGSLFCSDSGSFCEVVCRTDIISSSRAKIVQGF